MIDIERVRREIPALQNMIYLNAGSWGPMPTPVVDEIVTWYRFVEQHGDESRVAREAISQCYEKARRTLAEFMGADTDEIALLRAVSEGLNVVAHGLDLIAGDEVIVTNEEHPTGLLPWFNMHRRAAIKVRMLDVHAEEKEVLQRLNNLINERTRAIVLSHVTTETGVRLPAHEIVRIGHKHGIAVGFDGAQSVGQFPIDLHDMGCDFYCINGSKWLLGPNGTAAFYCRRDFMDRFSVSWTGSGASEQLDRPTGEFTFLPSARRFEFGARHWNLYAGLGRAVEYISEIGIAEIEERVGKLAGLLKSRLAEIPGVQVLTPRATDYSSGLVTFTLPGLTGPQISQALRDRWNIGSRSAWHDEACRVAIGFFTIESELDAVIRAGNELVRG